MPWATVDDLAVARVLHSEGLLWCRRTTPEPGKWFFLGTARSPQGISDKGTYEFGVLLEE